MPGQVSQMFERALDAVKGWFHLSALDKSAKLSSTLLGMTTVPAGRVAVLNDAGEFVLNRTTITNTGTAMPIFLWNGSDHSDVYNDGTSSVTDVVHWYGISPTGVMSGLVATGGYELQTTEFDSTQAYVANDLLTASTAGVLTNASAVQYTNWICGVASWHVNADNQTAAATSPVGTNAHGVSTLTFWTYFLPAAAQ
jgi:hypothetical protein